MRKDAETAAPVNGLMPDIWPCPVGIAKFIKDGVGGPLTPGDELDSAVYAALDPGLRQGLECRCPAAEDITVSGFVTAPLMVGLPVQRGCRQQRFISPSC